MLPRPLLRFLRRRWLPLALMGALGGFLAALAFLGFGWSEAAGVVRRLQHRQGPEAVAFRGASAEAPEDFMPLGPGVLTLRSGGLGLLQPGGLTEVLPNNGLIRLFPAEAGACWVAATYGRLLRWDAARGLQYLQRFPGGIREVRSAGERLAVAWEGQETGEGRVQVYRQGIQGLEPLGPPVAIGLDRWSRFDLAPDGTRILASLPSGRGVGLWSAEGGRLLAQWPGERKARILAFLADGRVVFDQGPDLTGQAGLARHAGNRLVVAGEGDPGTVFLSGFARPLGAALWPDRRRLAFGDMEGLVRLVDLAGTPRQAACFAPPGRASALRLRPSPEGLWGLFSEGETVRVERYAVP